MFGSRKTTKSCSSCITGKFSTFRKKSVNSSNLSVLTPTQESPFTCISRSSSVSLFLSDRAVRPSALSRRDIRCAARRQKIYPLTPVLLCVIFSLVHLHTNNQRVFQRFRSQSFLRVKAFACPVLCATPDASLEPTSRLCECHELPGSDGAFRRRAPEKPLVSAWGSRHRCSLHISVQRFS